MRASCSTLVVLALRSLMPWAANQKRDCWLQFDDLANQFWDEISANRNNNFTGEPSGRIRSCKFDVYNRLFLALRKLSANDQFQGLEMATGWSDSSLDMDFWCAHRQCAQIGAAGSGQLTCSSPQQRALGK